MGLFDKKLPVEDYDISCTECGKKISHKLPYCPHCKCNVVIPKKNSTPKNSQNKVILDKIIQDKIVQYKDPQCSVLAQFTLGDHDEFYKEFSKLTEEGYELKTTYVPSNNIEGFNANFESFFYFQKLKNS